MVDENKTKEQLITELRELRSKLNFLEVNQGKGEGALDHSRELLLTELINGFPDVAMLLDRDGVILALNQTLAARRGVSLNQVVGKSVYHFLPPESVERRKHQLEMVVQAKEPLEIQEKIGERYYETRVNPLKDPHGQVTKIAIFARDVTQLKKTTVDLEENNLNFRLLAENANDGILIAMGDGSHVFANQWIARITGYSIPELIKIKMKDLAHPQERQKLAEILQKRLDGEQVPKQYETLILNKYGQEVPVEVSGAKTTWHGQPADIVVVRDITERKREANNLKESEETTQALLNATFDSALLIDLNGTILNINDNAINAVGGVKNEIIGKCAYDLFPPSLAKTRKAQVQKIFRTKKPVTFEDERNGRIVFNNLNPVIDQHGQVTRIAIFGRDITEQKQVQEVLQNSEQKYRRLVENSPDILYSFSDKRGGVYYSNRVRTVLGYAPSYLLEHPKVWHDSIHPDDLPSVDQAIAGLKIGENFDVEYRIWDANENWLWFHDRSIGQWKEGDETIVEGLASDITERKRVEEALQQRVEQLAALQATTLEITSLHDLPNMLQAIVEWAALLLKASGGGMYLCDPVQGEVRCVVSYKTPIDYTGTVLKYGEGSAGTVAQTGQPLIVDDYRIWPLRAKAYEEDQPFAAVLSVPMIWKGEGSGVIHVLDNAEDRRFTQEDVELLTLFANQAATAIHNTRLFKSEQEQRRLAEALGEISQAVTSTLHLDEVLDQILNNVGRIVPHQGTNIHLLDEKSEIVRILRIRGYENTHRGMPGIGTTRPITEIPLYRQMMEARQAVVISDTHAEPNWTIFPGVDWVRSYLGIPVCRGERVFGFLNLDSAMPGFFTDKHAYQLQAFANQAAIAIENARLYTAEKQQRAELERTNKLIGALVQVAARVQAAPDPAAVMETLGTELKKLELACTVALFDPDDSSLVIRYVSIESKAFSRIEKTIKQSISGFRLALKTLTPYNELIDHHRAIAASGLEVASFATAVLPGFTQPVINRILKLVGVQPDTVAIILPLVIEDRLLGAFWLWGKNLQDADLPVFSTFASQLSIKLENARLFEQVKSGRESLQTLSHRLVEAQESERRSIARELHDEVGQNLTALKILLEYILNIPADAETKTAHLREAEELVNEISSKVQDLSLNLRPSMLDDLGLLPTLIWHIERFRSQARIKVDFEHRGLGRRFSTPLEVAVYRIVQEALTNVARHAKVDQVIVRVWADPDEIHIQVEDHGAGFDKAAVFASQDSAGLIGMNERSILVGGSLDIVSTPGEGTTVMVVLPLEERLERRIHER